MTKLYNYLYSDKRINIHILCIIFATAFCLWYQVNYPNKLKYEIRNYHEEKSSAIEVYEGANVIQTLYRPLNNIDEIQINITTYERTNLKGNLLITIYNNKVLVAHKEILINDIKDSDWINISLDKKEGTVGDIMVIELSADGETGSSVGVWKCKTLDEEVICPILTVNEKSNEEILYMAFLYNDCKLSPIWGILLIYVLTLAAYGNFKHNRNIKIVYEYTLLGIIGVLILCLRSGLFNYSIVYAEDGLYLSRIINSGFWKNAFLTRSGGVLNADFTNTGSYILLGVSWIINKAIYGYNLNNLPVIIGIISNCFYTFISLVGYGLFRKKSRLLAFTIFLSFHFVPVGSDTMEIFGRILNEVFVFPVLAILLFIRLWDSRYKSTFLTWVIQFVIFICCLSFPISFVALCVYMLFGIMKAIFDSKFKIFILANKLNIIILGLGCLMLPSMLRSKGASEGLAIVWEQLIEFIIARHFIYVFIYNIYNRMTDSIVLIIFIATISIVFYANLKEYVKNQKYLLFTFMVLCCNFASAIMRLSMSSMFTNYQSTFPDRYYYGCNILYEILVIWGICICCKNIIMKATFLISFIAFLLCNDQLFNISASINTYLGETHTVATAWQDNINNSRFIDGVNEVVIYPITREKIWVMEFPTAYIWASRSPNL